MNVYIELTKSNILLKILNKIGFFLKKLLFLMILINKIRNYLFEFSGLKGLNCFPAIHIS